MSTSKNTHLIDVEKALEVIRPEGSLSRLIQGYESREQQQAMLQQIIEAFHSDQVALIEAGTGIGKSMAYLIPAILWAALNKEKTIISTNTIALQEQLLHKDIPLAKKALRVDIKAVLVKGMSNYVCFRKVDDAKEERRLLPDREAEELESITHWCEVSQDGTLSDLSFVPSRNTWERVCAEVDMCTHKKCPHYKKCHFFKARQEAEEAQILVVNHSLLFADLAVQQKANEDVKETGGILPKYSRVIIDEAHNIESIATDFFADRVYYLQMLRILNRLGGDKQGKLGVLSQKLHFCFRKRCPEDVKSILTRLNIELPAMRQNLLQNTHTAFQSIIVFLHSFKAPEENPNNDWLQREQKQRILPQHLSLPYWKEEVTPSIQNLTKACTEYFSTIHHLLDDVSHVDHPNLKGEIDGIEHDIRALLNRLDNIRENLEAFSGSEYPVDKVRWVEAREYRTTTRIDLIDANLDISQLLAESLFRKFPTTILCSATLTTNQTFDFTKRRLGLLPEMLGKKSLTEHIYPSPFNYERQALFLVPMNLPNPSEPEYAKAISEKILAAIKASRGNAFILFTSYALLNQCYTKLQSTLTTHRYPLFKQGDANRKDLLTQFKETDRSVLFATASFWEGVDVVGEALRCVILVKLPFQVPSEPLLEARAESILANGGNPFMDFHIPHAIVKFKQGFGRLIRNHRDRGCILCLDPRVVKKSYGKLFLNSLPNCGKAFLDGEEIQHTMEEFYRKTYSLVNHT